MQPVLVLKVGDTYPDIASELGDFEDWILAGLGPLVGGVQVVDARYAALPDPHDYAGAVVTGSHSMVSDMPALSLETEEWLRCAVAIDLPILGICYGHQLLASAFGGEVGYHPEMEVGTVSIKTTDLVRMDALFHHLPASFQAYAVHSQSVLKLPPQAVRLAYNDYAFRIGDSAWGVQFCPDFSEMVMRRYVRKIADQLDYPACVASKSPAASILSKFSEFIQNHCYLRSVEASAKCLARSRFYGA